MERWGLTVLHAAMVTRHPMDSYNASGIPFLDRLLLYNIHLSINSCVWFWHFLGKAIRLGQDEDERIGIG